MPDRRFPQSARVSRRTLLLAPAGLALPRAVRATPVDAIAPGIAIPDTAAGRQLTWVLEQVNRAARGLSLREIRDHVAPAFLAALPADQLRTLLRSYVAPNGPLSAARFEGSVTDTHACVIALTPDRQMWRIRLGTGESDPHLINALYFEPVALPAGPARAIGKWSDLTEALGAIAPRSSFAAAELTADDPVWLSRLHGEQQLAIASAFKIYVLGTILHGVRARDLDWQEAITIQDEFRSLPNGDMRLLPAGMELPLQYVAERMIAGSDNTATDHLIGHLGRAQVQESFPRMGHSHSHGNTPLLFTREWFAIRMRFRDAQIERYLAADAGKRLRILAHTVDPLALQLSETEAWPGPRFLEEIEWFAGAADLVTGLNWLHRHAGGERGRPALDALSLNPGACWHPDTWRYVGYKGGYETGAMSNLWLLQRQDERWFAFAAVINDPSQEVDGISLWQLPTAAERLLAATT